MHSFVRYVCLFVLVFSGAVSIAAEKTEAEKLKEFLDQEWEYGLKENPIGATFLGDLRYNDQVGDSSVASVERRQQHSKDAFQRLQTIDSTKLSASDQLNYALYLNDLKLEIEGHQFPDYTMPITQLGGLPTQAPETVQFLPYNNTKQYNDYLSRLKQFPKLMDQIIERMDVGSKQKVTPPKITLREVGNQLKALMVDKAEESGFYRPFQKFPEAVSAADQERLRKEGKEVIEQQILPAYQKFYRYWTENYYPNTRETIAMSDLPNGNDWYNYRIKTYTTTDMTAEQIHQLGLKEVARIREEMDRVIRESGFKGTFKEFTDFLRKDPQFFYTKPEDLLAAYRDICKRIDAELPRFFGKLPRLPYGVREIPAYSAPSSTTAYYFQGSLEAGRPGWFYANTYKLETRPKWEMEALSIHEAVPGHHLQISIGQELENVPNFRKHGFYTAFGEGWGLYSESLGEEMGFYKDPYSKFGQLTYEMWRAVRLVVDTGMHAFGWDRQKAIDYFMNNSAKTEQDIVVEIDRYIVDPGQALAYKIGELKIKELRKYAKDQLGDQFDIRAFHDVVLGSGALPLSILEQNVKAWVAQKKQKK